VSAAALLDRLDGVRQTGPDRWLAKCPAHEDRRPSLSVRELDDGRVLVHDFAGCSFEEIIAAAGIEAHELFPPRLAADFVRGERRSFPVADVFKAVADETFYVAFMAATIAGGHQLTPTDKALLWQSFDRIMEARRLCLGR
jgi:hypothetical protein